MSHEDAARVRHCQPRVHLIWMSDSLPCIICVVLHLCDGRRDRVAREIYVDQQLYSYSFLSSFFSYTGKFYFKIQLNFSQKESGVAVSSIYAGHWPVSTQANAAVS